MDERLKFIAHLLDGEKMAPLCRVKTESLLVLILGLSMLAQVALVLRWPLPSVLPWTIIAAAGAATVLSFALMSEYFPKAMSGRANGALNLLHVGGAFVLPSATGVIIGQWTQTAGGYPAEAHQAAMAMPLLLQVIALAWLTCQRRQRALAMRHTTGGLSAGRPAHWCCLPMWQAYARGKTKPGTPAVR